MNNFILSCESTVDMPFAQVNARDISVLFYSYTAGGEDYTDDMDRDPEALPRFYELLKKEIPSTSQINEYQYFDYFSKLLKEGDVLHIVFSSGLTKSIHGAESAAEKLRERYPDRKLIVIDSMCASSGYGMLVDYAADLRDEGASIDEVAEWVDKARHKVQHQFFSTDLKYYRKSGRMSGAAATVATILNICPILRIDDKGKIIAYDKVRGKRNAINYIMNVIAEHADGGENYSGKVFISHSNTIEDAEDTKKEIERRFKKIDGKVKIFNIGTIIASHTGPGTVAVFFMGDERK
ncbi:MAG: DegV family protein [Ruminococcus sp.]|nr:DegV family protein [Ruminococcus sp.]